MFNLQVLPFPTNLKFQLLSGSILAGQVYAEQLRWGWPGLSQEATAISEHLGICNVNELAFNEMSSVMWKKLVSSAVWKDNEQYLHNKMGGKLEDIESDSFGRKAYLSNTSIEISRMMIKTDGLACESCNKVYTETQVLCYCAWHM